MKKASTSRVVSEKEQLLPVRLTEQERVSRGRELAQTLSDIKSEESRAEMVKASLKSAMASLEARRDELGVVVQRGEEIRSVKVQDVADDSALRIARVRMDTGEVLTEREMTADEKQLVLEPAKA